MVWWFNRLFGWRKPKKKTSKFGDALYTFKVIVDPSLDKKFVEQALRMLPRVFDFELVDWDEGLLFKYQHADWKGFWMPLFKGYIVLFDGRKANVRYGGGSLEMRAGIAYFGDNLYDFAVRIFHELAHAIGLDADNMCGSNFKDSLEEKHKSHLEDVCRRGGHDQIYHLRYLYCLLEKKLKDK